VGGVEAYDEQETPPAQYLEALRCVIQYWTTNYKMVRTQHNSSYGISF